MQRIFGIISEKAKQLLSDGTCNRMIGWKRGEFFYAPHRPFSREPATWRILSMMASAEAI